MTITNDSSPHENEYLAAVSGLHEQTPSQRHEPAVGDFISGDTNGHKWRGYVQWLDVDRPTPHVVIREGDALNPYPLADRTH